MRERDSRAKQNPKGTDYRKLKRKIGRQTILMLMGAYLGVWGFYLFFWHGKFANFVVMILQNFAGMDYDRALDVYRYLFRANFSYIMLGAALIVFLILFRFFLNWFMKYFNEIDSSTDKLMERGDEEIKMSPEMEPMERKLNYIQQTLEQQFLDIQESERKKDELVMYLAHDIRTPLTSVIGYLKLMQEIPDLTEEQRQEFCRITLEKAEHLEVLVNEFFDITRYNRQEIELNKGNIDIYYLLLQLKEEMYPMLAEKNMTLRVEAAEDSIVYGNGEKLARVFHNLLKNAISYGDRDTEIVIRVEETEKETILSFMNQGKNLSKEECNRIFDKFYRMDEARQTNSGGAGLGLAIAKELVQMHGGQIEAASMEGVTTFMVVLPKESKIL